MKVLRSTQVLLCLILCLVLLIGLSACDDDKPTTPGMNFGLISGTVYAPGRAVLEGVTVSVGDQSTSSDASGAFILSGLEAGARVQVEFSKDGYLSTQKIVSIVKGRTSYLSATLFTAYTTSFVANQSFVIDSGATLEIPQDAFVLPGGGSFTGTVKAEVCYFDPTNPDAINAFPGQFSGVQENGQSTMFESYGFISASFRDAQLPEVELKLASGKTVGITTPIPFILQENAPQTMPMWYYDEEDGLWREEGVATRQGNYYVGSVSHFSYWNFDHPVVIDDQATLTGRVMTAERGEPIPGAQVVATGVGYTGYTVTYTNDEGEFSVTVKANAQAKLQAFAGNNASYQTAALDTPAGGTSLAVDDLVIEDRSFTIMGRLVDTNGTPFTGYGQITQVNIPDGEMGFSAWLTVDSEGRFRLSTQNYSNSTSFNVLISLQTRGGNYSAHIPFVVPQPGNIWDFGTVTLRPGGTLTGKARKSDGTYFANIWISFMKEGQQGEGSHFSASVDAEGNFTMQGPPNTNVSSVRGSAYEEGIVYRSDLLTLRFPASGTSRNMGTITFTQQTE